MDLKINFGKLKIILKSFIIKGGILMIKKVIKALLIAVILCTSIIGFCGCGNINSY